MIFPTATVADASNAVSTTKDGYNSKIVCTKYEYAFDKYINTIFEILLNDAVASFVVSTM